MFSVLRNTVLAAVLAVALAGTAQAVPIMWDLQGVSADGSTLTGSFSYNADTNVYSNVSVKISGGGLINATYTNVFEAETKLFFATTVAQPDLTGLPAISLGFVEVLTDAGGTVGVLFAGTATCSNASCTTTFLPFSASGFVVAAVPEPASLAMLAMGLAGLGLVLRTRRA